MIARTAVLRRGRLRVLLPTLTNAALRSTLLLVLAALTTASTGAERSALVAGFALLGSFAMVFDSGAGNFLLSSDRAEVTTVLHARVTRLQGCLSVSGLVAAMAFVLVTSQGVLSRSAIAVLIALGLSQLLDGLGRVARAPLLLAARDDLYALPDVALLACKLPLVLLAIGQADLTWLVLLPVPSGVVAVVSFVRVQRSLDAGCAAVRHLEVRVLEFGVTGALSAFYAQAPLLMGALVLPVEQLAPLGLVFRLIQALEVVPATASQQMTPRARDQRPRFIRYTLVFLSFGAVVSTGLIVGRDLLASLLVVDLGPTPVYVLIALAYTLRCGNYYLVALLMGTGMIRTRFVMAALLGVSTSGAALIGGLVSGVVGLAVVTVGSEVVIVTATALAIAAANRRAVATALGTLIGVDHSTRQQHEHISTADRIKGAAA